ncbi:N-acetylglucosamine-6-phosphate deacetylase [Actinosynnema sp. NPDC047251]|uniref:N-acetylglucosamine-6-phosphate deacetylase n=1 Tax=Saccharothrix espanaensis (strain ATCC 51144 / DSM 44229 / JCM 9112 / NBRC 15066 / NRRL 15764) TaxID=1179773 RepID=K0JNU0_SACES|nr:N-acetylglucosamine-6-phosphate deacetylase [Saccharothrix espanaensis]CCH27770.1 N-acetylglucosamine-6-phosphate deacetylase [Saccharothrix espanaensis DSM 44229]
MDTVVAAPRVLLGRTITGPASVRVRAGRILDVVPGDPPAGAEVLAGGLLTPGLVDVQVNGAVGVDFAEVDDEGMRYVALSLPKTGVTRFLPTLITAPVPVALRQARAVLAASAALPEGSGARPLGVHLEGPFLSPKRPGVHDPALMVEPGPAEIDLLLADDLRAALRMVTLAPEQPGGLAAVRRLSEAGVLVAVGHSDATGEQTRAAAEAGARMITHLFNAQRPLGHREPGVPGVALVDDRFTLGLIADLAHVGPDVCRLVFNAAGHRVALVTDAVAAAGMPPGRYQLGGEVVVLSEDGVPRSPEGTIAGSALTLDRAVRNIVSVGVDVADALAAATITPADAIGEPTLGRLEPGAVADLVWWDDDLRPRKVWVDGEVVFDAELDLNQQFAAAR